MEQLVQQLEAQVVQMRGDPQQEAINNLNAQLWRVMTSQLQLWSTAVDNHKDHIVRHYRYLHALHANSKERFDKVVHDVGNKLKEIEDKVGATQDFPAIVANEVQKHHAAFSLVGSEVARGTRSSTP